MTGDWTLFARDRLALAWMQGEKDRRAGLTIHDCPYERVSYVVIGPMPGIQTVLGVRTVLYHRPESGRAGMLTLRRFLRDFTRVVPAHSKRGASDE